MVTRKFTQEEVKKISDVCNSLKPYVTELVITNGNIIQYDDNTQIIFDIRNIITEESNFTWIISDVKTNSSVFEIFDEFTVTIDDEKGFFEITDEKQSMQIRFVEPSNVILTPEELDFEILHSIKLSSQDVKKIKKMLDMVKTVTFEIVDDKGILLLTSQSKSKTRKFSVKLCETPEFLQGSQLKYLYTLFDVVTKLQTTEDVELQFVNNQGDTDVILKLDDNTRVIGRKIEEELSSLFYGFETEEVT